jgi:signal transduction histidine kinase
MQTEMLEMQTKHKIDKNKLHNITTLSRDTISHMRDLVWSIDSRRDTVADLIERMQELAEEMLLPAQITYNIEADELNPNRKINLNCKRNLFLIYKEAITNIIKHSNADAVNVKIFNKNDRFLLYIKDNGQVETFECGTGMGLANMKLRCESIKGQLDFNFESGFGVRVDLPYAL